MYEIPKINSGVNKVALKELIYDNDLNFGPEYMSFLGEWITGTYKAFNDADKYTILVYLFRKNSSTPVITYTAENGIFFNQVSISKEGNYLAATGGPHLYFLSTNSSNPIWSYNNSNGRWFSSVDISADGSHIIAVEGNEPGLAGGDGMFLFAKDNNTPIRNYTIDCMKGQSNSMGCLSSASFSPSEEALPVASPQELATPLLDPSATENQARRTLMILHLLCHHHDNWQTLQCLSVTT